jgi:2-phosphoglycerate kinase
MKTYVINDKEQTRIPFLRGILIRSLLDAGLEFEDAYGLATRLREDLQGQAEVQSSKIRERVYRLLEKEGHLGALEPYSLPLVGSSRVNVVGTDGKERAFSRGRLERNLQASGLRAERAEQVTHRIYEQLLLVGVASLSSDQLAYITFACIRKEISKKASRRYRVWIEYQRANRPLLLLICGSVGTGKSTIATEVANLIDIVRIQSTDMLREVTRMMMPERLLPVLHQSSFNAWKALPIQDADERDRDQLIADGYRTQANLLAVSCEAVLNRALKEGLPVILEGVHAHPELAGMIEQQPDAIVVHITLAVLRPGELKARLRGRSSEAPRRQKTRYLENFDSIWSLQSFLLSEADRCDTAIITNDSREDAIVKLIRTVNFELSRHFKGSSRDVFGEFADLAEDLPDRENWQDLVSLLVEAEPA